MENNVVMLGMYVFVCVGLLFNAYMYLTLPETVECTLKTKDGMTISGNCEYISDLRNEIIEIQLYNSVEVDNRIRRGSQCSRLYELYLMETT